MPLFLMFLAIPLLEIAAFIVIGGKIGIGPTLAAVVLTALAGSMLLRRQGLAVLARIRADMEARRMPGKALAEGAMIAAAGLLLLTPGFVTDAAGFALFLPPVRTFLWQWIGRRIEVGFVGDPAADRGRGPGAAGIPAPARCGSGRDRSGCRRLFGPPRSGQPVAGRKGQIAAPHRDRPGGIVACGRAC